MRASGLAYASVQELRDGYRSGTWSVHEVAGYFLERIRLHEPAVNCWVTVDESLVMAQARKLDDRRREIDGLPLFGIPVGVKDLTPTAGLRTTYGSKLFEHYVPECDAVVVERLRQSGALILGKTNTPEFGVGGNTFNDVAGTTRNPWDLAKTVGGSSGGSAAALAAGMCTLAEGSDMAGSLRIPAAYCGVMGFRATPGYFPEVPADLAWDTLAVTGPMARTVDDIAAMSECIRGPHAGAPLSSLVAKNLWEGNDLPVRIGFCMGLDLIDVAPAVQRSVRATVEVLRRAGFDVQEIELDFGPIREVSQLLRVARMAGIFGEYSKQSDVTLHPGLLADIAEGRKISAEQLIRADVERGRIYSRLQRVWTTCDLLIMPAVPLPPFDHGIVAPTRVGETRLDVYSEWMILTHAVTLMNWPVLAVPSEPTVKGLPLGIQLVGKPSEEGKLLGFGRRYEKLSAHWVGRRPPLNSRDN